MKGKLIIIESGSDGSGKATQSEYLYNRLIKDNTKVRKVEFPNYKSEASALVKMYLRGDFGKDPSDVSPYIASTFFTVDRYASYKKDWEEFYKDGGIIISDRYTTSNMVHQASKFSTKKEKDDFLDWLWDFEFNLYGLPVPDKVFFLDMPVEFTQKLTFNRKNKITGEKEKDIHESNRKYLETTYDNGVYIAKKYGWERVECIENDKVKTIREISDFIYDSAISLINDNGDGDKLGN
ncbi:dTMP kinase [Acetoanaerobium pronyense]|uniref:Thymidylate kinase n=1 Tax=Acetoanaerobium pronyense TaxID=1482736 RepID=A0ABS4KJU3_9FIRM|nr:thymidylate kinase [Acetoanaerobium pronyense]MBP2028057.1 dTMP kinase [Acetoanaerobium pronyense]